ncbi:MAG: hypothetical protein H0V54_11865, partial [Chthoniobacterales bacterium]|nr:hypothetical protein [Chthoniobacterales bacterium]
MPAVFISYSRKDFYFAESLAFHLAARGMADGFEYDKNAQLTKFRLNGTLSSGAVTGGTATSYTMDASGNRTN